MFHNKQIIFLIGSLTIKSEVLLIYLIMVKEDFKVAEISVSYRPAIANKPFIVSSLDAYVLFKPFFPESTIHLQEQFMVMYLNRANRVLGIYPMSIGGINGTVVDIRLILSIALTTAATSIILAHNHPSGNMKSSKADVELTTRIKEGAKIMDIKLFDHLIISPVDGVYSSFADEGLI